jgi:hypothetical protein
VGINKTKLHRQDVDDGSVASSFCSIYSFLVSGVDRYQNREEVKMSVKWTVSKIKPNPVVLKIMVGGNPLSIAFSEAEAQDLAYALRMAGTPENIQYSRHSDPDLTPMPG